MRFGAFEYPDFFIFENASAFCLDCGIEIVGRAVINAADSEHCVAAIEGELVYSCGAHHDKMRSYKGGPQHAAFRVADGNRILGETGPIPSIGSKEIFFRITDVNLGKEFVQKHRELQAAFRRFWGYNKNSQR